MKHEPLKPLYLSRFVTIQDEPVQPAPRQLPANIKQLKRVYRQLREFNDKPAPFRWHKLIGVGVALVVMAGIESLPQAQQLYTTPKPVAVKQATDRDSGRPEKLPIAYADDTITITFHNCRENAKHHWSCQRVDGDDTDHFVYIPGLQPKQVHASSFANQPDKEDK